MRVFRNDNLNGIIIQHKNTLFGLKAVPPDTPIDTLNHLFHQISQGTAISYYLCDSLTASANTLQNNPKTSLP